jgi:LuxR family quorum sensing-dependent transcriptional regulator
LTKFVGSPDIARRAFDAVAAAQRATTVPELNAVLDLSLGRMGFSNFLGARATKAPDGMAVEILFGAKHQAWEAHYQGHGYARHDAVLREMLVTGEPLFWSDLPTRGPVAADGQKVLEEAKSFGLQEGFATPIFNLDGSISTILLMGENIESQNPDVRAAAHLLSLYYGSIGARLHRSVRRNSVPRHLTPRQLECLKWVREGKSSTDIGDILGLSGYTVDEHLAAACARLGVRSRVQAVVEAALDGLLEL